MASSDQLAICQDRWKAEASNPVADTQIANYIGFVFSEQ